MSDHKALAPNNVAVITGGADGIGLAAAERFANRGMHVVLVDINSDKLADAKAQIEDTASNEITVVSKTIDVADFSALAQLSSEIFAQFGHVDVLMNNAGRSGKTSSWGEIDVWREIFDVNLWGIVHGMHAFTEKMVNQSRPALIINTGSKQGITNPPGNPAYNASKAAVKAATESLQHALRSIDGCLVSAHLLVPGYTFTGLTRQRQSDKPAGAWHPEQVIDYLLDAIDKGKFYIICPDNEVTEEDDVKRVLWGAGDLAYGRTPLSRWDENYADEFAKFIP